MDATETFDFSRDMFGSKYRLVVAACLAKIPEDVVTGIVVRRALKASFGIDVNHNLVMVELRRLARGGRVLTEDEAGASREQPFGIRDRVFLEWCQELAARLHAAAA